MVNPLVTDMHCMDLSPYPIEQALTDLYPSCAITRPMAKEAFLTENQSAIDLTDFFIGQSFKDEINKSLFHKLPERQTEVNGSTLVSKSFFSIFSCRRP